MGATSPSDTERNIEAVWRFYAAGPADDDRDRAALATPDVVWHVPGANRVSGDYVGPTEVFDTMGARMQPLDEWKIEVLTVMANADRVMASVRVIAARGAHRVDCAGGHVFRLDPEGRIAEAWGFVEDQAGLDALLDA